MLKLSIIIPVYNSEKYLSECLTTVFQQDLASSEYEVILINDGSTDDSKKIMLTFKQKYCNLVFIDQRNRGVSAARNAGLQIAKGEYVTFIDSDDFIVEKSLEPLLHYIYVNNLDILYASLETVNERGEHISIFPETGLENEIKNGLLHPRRTYPPTFYKNSLIGELRFEKRISIGEDTLFNCMVQAKAKRVSYFSALYYKHTRRSNSLSTSPDFEKKTMEMYLAVEVLLKFIKENYSPLTSDAEKYFNTVVQIFMTRIIQWSIIPTVNKNNFFKFQNFVEDKGIKHLRDKLAYQFPTIEKSYLRFYVHHKIKFLSAVVIRKLAKISLIKSK